MPNWYIYLVRCCDGSLYTGITTDVEHRFAEHVSGVGPQYLRASNRAVAGRQRQSRRQSQLLITGMNRPPYSFTFGAATLAL